MSVISNRHAVVSFVTGESKALANQRLAKVGYKGKTAKFKSVCASVPKIDPLVVENHLDALMPHVIGMLEEVQNGVFRSLYESASGKLEHLTDDDISIQALIGYLEAESTGGRLTKESVIAWFNAEALEITLALLAEKLGFSDTLNEDQMAVLEKHANGYREVFASLSGGKTMLQPKQINGLRKVLGMISADDDISVKLTKRLDVMEKNLNAQEEMGMLL